MTDGAATATMAATLARPAYRRILLKISGEALMGPQQFGLHPPTVERIAEEVAELHRPRRRDRHGDRRRQHLPRAAGLGAGDGAHHRRLYGHAGDGDERARDAVGARERLGVHTRVVSAIPMDQVCEPYIRRRAVRHLEKGRVVIFAAGTGNPYFTTDTAATLRASEMSCEAMFKGTQVDGVYDSDPRKNPDARRFDRISYDTVLQKHLKVMDAAAIALARDNGLPIVVFALDEPNGLAGIVQGRGRFTIVEPG